MRRHSRSLATKSELADRAQIEADMAADGERRAEAIADLARMAAHDLYREETTHDA